MTELKTFKEIARPYGCLDGLFSDLMKNFNLDSDMASETQHVCSHLSEDIRQEAIRWIKSIDNPLEDRKNMELLNLKTDTNERIEESETCLFGARRFIIYFFNITDEDMK